MLWDFYNNTPTFSLNGMGHLVPIPGRMHTYEPPVNISLTEYRELVSKGLLKRTTSDGVPIDEELVIQTTTRDGR